MKTKIRICAFVLVLVFVVSAFSFSVSADDDTPLLFVSTSYSNNSGASPDNSTYSSTSTYPAAPFDVVCSGSHTRINSLSVRTDGITSSNLFVRADFTVVAVKSQGTQAASISELFPVSINNYNANHTASVTVSNSNYSVRCYEYMLGEYLGDLENLWISGASEQWVVRGNKTISLLLEIQCPAENTVNGITVTLNNPISLYHTLNRQDTLYLIPTNVSSYTNSSEALFSYLVDIRDELIAIGGYTNQDQYNTSGIWTFLLNHAADIDMISVIADLLEDDPNGWLGKTYTLVTTIKNYLYNMVQRIYEVRYIDEAGNLVTRNNFWWDAILGELRLINYDLVRSYDYQQTIDAASTDEDDQSALDYAIGALSDANAVGSITGFTGIFNMAPNDPEMLTNHGATGFLFWFTQENYDDIQQNPVPRSPGEEWVMPYNDKVRRMMEELGEEVEPDEPPD